MDDYLEMYANEKEISEDSKSVALHEWLQCKSAEEIQAAIDSTAVPMPASIKKQAKERIKVLQEEAARGIERARPMMKQDVREQRRAELSEALRQRHPDIQIRSDSKMCDSYLKLNRRDDVKLDQVGIDLDRRAHVQTQLSLALRARSFARSPISCTRCGFCSTTQATMSCRVSAAMPQSISAT